MVSRSHDDAESFLPNFETELPDPDEASGTLIGFYRVWALDAGTSAAMFDTRAASVRQRKPSGCALLWQQCDGELTTDDLNESGNAFTQAHCAQRYVDDDRRVFPIDTLEDDALCKVPNTWVDDERIAAQLSERLETTLSPLLDRVASSAIRTSFRSASTKSACSGSRAPGAITRYGCAPSTTARTPAAFT